MEAEPLSGHLVVDLSRHLPGPLAARLLGDLGARVVKVEEPGAGDPLRAAPPLRDGKSPLAHLLLGGVESIALDLGREPAREVLERLLARADVLLESFRPGHLARWGLAPEALRERHPRLVICSISGWGQGGPHAARAGHDLTYQAVAGSLAGGRAMPALPLADHLGAWSAVAAVLAALVPRGIEGQGTWIDAALFDAAAHANLTGWAAEAERPRPAGEPLPLSGAYPCYRIYRTRDGGEVALAALEPKFWRRLCDATGRPDLARAQFDGSAGTGARVAELFGSRTRAEWEALFAEHDLPAEPLLSAAEARAHPQAEERGLLTWHEGLPRAGFPALLGGERPRRSGAVPDLGADTERLLREIGAPQAGWSGDERRAGGIGRRPPAPVRSPAEVRTATDAGDVRNAARRTLRD